MIRMTGLALAIMIVAGGASSGAPKMQDAKLVGSSVAIPGATYDAVSGHCSAGSVQLVSQAEIKSLEDGWSTPATCKPASRAETPSTALYPKGSSYKSGSAQVLVRLQPDGSVESVHAVCASDPAFVQAAENAAKTIHYAPSTCDGVPRRSVFFEPFHYDR